MLGRFGAFGDPGEQGGLPEGNTCGLNPKKGKVSQRDEPKKRKKKTTFFLAEETNLSKFPV